MKASNLKPPAYGKRMASPKLEDLRESLQKYGELQPIVIRPNGEVIIGERRRQALRPEEEAAVVVRDVDEVAALEMRLSDEFAKAEMTSVERGEALLELRRLLKERGVKVSHSTLAERIGTTVPTIEAYVELVANLPDPVKEMVHQGEVGRTAAEALARATKLEPDEKVTLAKKFAAGDAPGGMKAREVVQFAQTAPESIRRHLTENPRTSYREVKDFVERQAEREEARQRRESADDLMAMRAAAFFHKVREKLRMWALAMDSVVPLAAEVPETMKPDLTRWAERLKDSCSHFLERMEGERDAPIPAGLLHRAEQEWE